MNILDKIVENTVERIEKEKKEISTWDLYRIIDENEASGIYGKRPTFLENLRKPGMSYICEVKKASPSKGIIAEEFPYIDIAIDYEKAGASAISCLTEPNWFMGSNKYLKGIAQKVRIPIIKKDFTIDEYMILQGKAYGASAILLICAVLDDAKLKSYLDMAHDLGLHALIEAHDEYEVERALKSGGQIIGVNNRNLKDFSVDMRNSISLREKAPESAVFVSESGIKTSDDIKLLYDNNVDAVLIGETLMRSNDKKVALETLNGGPVK